jgi:hypothetical protein
MDDKFLEQGIKIRVLVKLLKDSIDMYQMYVEIEHWVVTVRGNQFKVGAKTITVCER